MYARIMNQSFVSFFLIRTYEGVVDRTHLVMIVDDRLVYKRNPGIDGVFISVSVRCLCEF